MIALVLLGLAAGGCGTPAVTGTIDVRAGALPPDASIAVELFMVTDFGFPPRPIASTTVRPSGRMLPVPFRLTYDPKLIDKDRRYSVFARVRRGEDELFMSDLINPVITQGSPTEVGLVLHAMPPRVRYVGFRTAPATAGRLSISSDSTLRFESCGASPSAMTIEDLASGEGRKLIHDLGQGSGIPVVARVNDGKLLEIRFAGPGETNCDALLWTGELQAKGNEPFWTVYVDEGEVGFVTPEDQSGVHYSHGAWSHPDSTHWRCKAIGRDGAELTLDIEAAPCHDSMSGARYPFKAVVTRGGIRMTGCALEGRRAMGG